MERLTEIKALIDTKRTTRLPKELNSQRLLGMLFVLFYLRCVLLLPAVRPSSRATSKESSTMQRHPAHGEN
jgi:hypothetical protein